MSEHDDRVLTLYQLFFENWRFQVKSNWDRSNYFAAFELAIFAGSWRTIDFSPAAGAFFVLLGAALTLAWTLSNHKAGHYIEYWWATLARLEGELQDPPVTFIRNYDSHSREFGIAKLWPKLRYSTLMQSVPTVFAAAWIGLGVRAMLALNRQHSLACWSWALPSVLSIAWISVQCYLLAESAQERNAASGNVASSNT